MHLTENFYKNDSCDKEVIKKTEDELGKVFPKDYVDFLLWSDGGEGEIGENYISFWRCEDIAQLNKDYGIHKYLTKDFVAFGTDGGGECYAFDYRDRNPKIVNSNADVILVCTVIPDWNEDFPFWLSLQSEYE